MFLFFTLILVFPLTKLIAQDHYDLIFTNIVLFDGYSFQPSVTVFIKNGIVEQVITGNQDYRATATTVINGNGKTLMPGLINAHVHLQGKKENLKEAARAGVLTLLDLFNTSDTLRHYNDSSQYASYFSAGICVTAPKGHGTEYGIDIPTITSPQEADNFVKSRILEGSDYIKIILESGSKGQTPSLNDSILYAVLNACKKYNKLSVVHISRAKDALRAFVAGADGLAHIWTRDSIPISDKELEILTQRPFFIIPTLTVKEGTLERHKKNGDPITSMDMPGFYKEVYRLYKKNIPILAGTDCPNEGVNFGTDLYKEINAFINAGMSPSDALKSATSAPANAFHLTDRGIIAKGKRADLLLVKGNLSDGILKTDSIIGIWKAGIRIK